ncbi:MAG: 3-dehydroquinate synthase, partial [Thermomicrobiales bacterium]
QLERAILIEELQRESVVIATGGGAAAEKDAWRADLLGGSGVLTVTLDAAPETSLARLRAQVVAEGDALARPLLAGSDPLVRIAALKGHRQAAYDRAGVTLPIDRVDAPGVADEIAAMVRGDMAEVQLRLPHSLSRIVIEPGVLANVGSLTRETYPNARRAWVISDDGVAPHHLPAMIRSLNDAGFRCEPHVVAHGEASKSIAGASSLYDALLTGGVERRDVIVALGGGVVGDLAGFVAATTLRGIGLVQVPTSLLAMFDSSVGGKTGVNHAAGKNLIGAFYQPPIVVIDPMVLSTLPAREFTSGWSEVIKHAVIQPSTPQGDRSDLWTFLERNADSLLGRGEPAMTYLIQRNVALKARVVEADEREAGLRAFLNFGHTIGHAIEAAGYQLLHGEAVAVGMRAAMRLGERMGTCDHSTVVRLDQLLDRYGLPTTATASPERVVELLGSDKKKQAGKQRWVLPRQGGGVALRDDVPERIVAEVLDDVLQV